MPASSEIGRTVRHAVTPVVIILVERGYLPEAAQHDVIEFGVIVAAFIGAYGYSWWQDKKELKAQQAKEKQQ